MTDRYGRTWFLPKEELCPECGQPDNCGDCEHEPLSDYDYALLGVPQISAPWSDDQVASLNAYQRSGVFHEFTCGTEHAVHQMLLATTDGWVCPTNCGYRQEWAWGWMADWSWEELARGEA